MKAMALPEVSRVEEGSEPLKLMEFPVPVPGRGEILLRVTACGVCHTELDEIEGRTPPAFFPVIPGHEVVGIVEKTGAGAVTRRPGERVGVAWFYSSCGRCRYCQTGRENLCARFRATGRDAHGGYAEYMVVPEASAYPIPGIFSDMEAAPLLCAGAVGYRSMKLADVENGRSVGLTGFGASGHLVLKMLRYRYPDSKVFVFARNPRERTFALELGAAWAGDTDDIPPEPPEYIIDTTPVWKPVVAALKVLAPGGRLVINAIRKEDADKKSLLDIQYDEHLWMEKSIKSVANVTRRDVTEFLSLAAEIPIRPEYQTYSLTEANTALWELKAGRIRGAKVLKI